MDAHADDLRSEVHDDELVSAIRTDYRAARIDGPTRALLDHAVLLTREPWEVTDENIQKLRDHGFSDRAIHDATQVTAYFNYINRIADGTGIDPED